MLSKLWLDERSEDLSNYTDFEGTAMLNECREMMAKARMKLTYLQYEGTKLKTGQESAGSKEWTVYGSPASSRII